MWIISDEIIVSAPEGGYIPSNMVIIILLFNWDWYLQLVNIEYSTWFDNINVAMLLGEAEYDTGFASVTTN